MISCFLLCSVDKTKGEVGRLLQEECWAGHL